MASGADWHSGQKDKEIGFSEFLSEVDAGNVHDAMIIGQEVRGKLKNDTPFHTMRRPNYPDMYKTLRDKAVPFSVKDIRVDPGQAGC